MPPIDHVHIAVWNPESNKVVFLIVEDTISDGINLFIFDLQTDSLNFIATEFHYITALDWANDSQNIIISGVIGKREGYTINNLFLE